MNVRGMAGRRTDGKPRIHNTTMNNQPISPIFKPDQAPLVANQPPPVTTTPPAKNEGQSHSGKRAAAKFWANYPTPESRSKLMRERHAKRKAERLKSQQPVAPAATPQPAPGDRYKELLDEHLADEASDFMVMTADFYAFAAALKIDLPGERVTDPRGNDCTKIVIHALRRQLKRRLDQLEAESLANTLERKKWR
jgi:hypothetical protein